MHPLFFVLTLQFGLNFVWENLQKGIFAGYDFLWGGGQLCWLGPVGDTRFGFVAYSPFVFVKRDWRWILRATGHGFLLVGFLGLAWGWVSELVAQAFDLWQYKPGVPTVFSSAYGPLIELALTMPLAFFLAQRLSSKTR